MSHFFGVATMAKEPTHISLAEIDRSPMFIPIYGALATGIFRKHGIAVEINTARGPDATTAALLTGGADIGMAGAEQAVFVANAASQPKLKIIGALSRLDGTFLVSRVKPAGQSFSWDALRGKTVLAWRTGSTPALYLERAVRRHGLQPRVDFEYWTQTPIPARERVWREGRADFAVFFEPDVSRFERERIGYPVASIGQEAGPSIYTVFLATAEFAERNPVLLQAWKNATRDALTWVVTTEPAQAARAVARYFSNSPARDVTTAIERLRSIDFWSRDPTVSRSAIAEFQDMMVSSGALREADRTSYETIVETLIAEPSARPVH